MTALDASASTFSSGSSLAIAESLAVFDTMTGSGGTIGFAGSTFRILGTQTLAAYLETVRATMAEGQTAADNRMLPTASILAYSGATIWRDKYATGVSGGHGDSYDDGGYAQDLVTGAWETLIMPSTAGNGSNAADANGEWTANPNRPASQHSYFHNVTVGDDIIQGYGFAIGFAATGSYQGHRFKNSTRLWERYGDAPSTGSISSRIVIHDERRARIIRFSAIGGSVQTIVSNNSAATWTTTSVLADFPFSSQGASVGYHPNLDCFAAYDQAGFANRLWVMDAGDIHAGWSEVAVVGTFPAVTSGGLEFIPPMRAFLSTSALDADKGKFYYLTPTGGTRTGTWTWTSETFTGATTPASWPPSPELNTYSRARWSNLLNGVVVVKRPSSLTEIYTPALAAPAGAAAEWAARKAESGVVAAYDFSAAPANGGDWKWGSLSASPKVTVWAQNDTNYAEYRKVDTTIYPPGSTASLRWDVPDCPSGATLGFASDVQGATSGTLNYAYLSGTYSAVFSNPAASARTVTVSGTSVTWSGALPSGTAITSMNLPAQGMAERADIWRVSIDNYTDQFDGDTARNEFWVQWRTRMDSTYSSFRFLDRQVSPSDTAYKQILIGEGMQQLFAAPGASTSWPHGYEGVGTSQSINNISYTNCDSEGETNIINGIGTNSSYTSGYGFKYPRSYHGKPGYAPLTTRGTDSSWFTEHNSGNEAAHTAACQFDGSSPSVYTDKNTCFIYPADQWFTMMVHVILGPRGYGASALDSSGFAILATPAAYVDATHIRLTAGSFSGHFDGAGASAGIHIKVTGALTGTVTAQVTLKVNEGSTALLTIGTVTGGTIRNEALTVDEYENGFTNSTIEYYAAYSGGSMQLLHKRTGVVMRCGNYTYDTPGYSPISRYGSFGFTTFMTDKSLTQTHPTGKVWISQVIVKSGSTAPSTPAY